MSVEQHNAIRFGQVRQIRRITGNYFLRPLTSGGCGVLCDVLIKSHHWRSHTMTENNRFLNANDSSEIVNSSSDSLRMILVPFVFLLPVREHTIRTERNVPALGQFGTGCKSGVARKRMHDKDANRTGIRVGSTWRVRFAQNSGIYILKP